MSPSSRPRGTVTYVAVAVSLLALLVATTSAAFAAGLAANSVGAKQLKKNAVTAKKIRNNAVTTAKIKKGAVTADRIAPGAVPAKTVHIARALPISGSVTPLLKLDGLSFDAECSPLAQDSVKVAITRTGGGPLTASGIVSFESSTADATASPYVDEQNTEVELLANAPSPDAFATIAFAGVVTAAGHGPVQVQAAVQVVDGTTTACQIYLTATPIG
jgi:hypothetical protein